MFHKTGGNMTGAGSVKADYPPILPEGTTHVWTPAVERPIINGWVYRRACYKPSVLNWVSWSPIAKQWILSKNNKDWFDKETKEGYFVTLEQFKDPDFVIKPEKMNG